MTANELNYTVEQIMGHAGSVLVDLADTTFSQGDSHSSTIHIDLGVVNKGKQDSVGSRLVIPLNEGSYPHEGFITGVSFKNALATSGSPLIMRLDKKPKSNTGGDAAWKAVQVHTREFSVAGVPKALKGFALIPQMVSTTRDFNCTTSLKSEATSAMLSMLDLYPAPNWHQQRFGIFSHDAEDQKTIIQFTRRRRDLSLEVSETINKLQAFLLSATMNDIVTRMVNYTIQNLPEYVQLETEIRTKYATEAEAKEAYNEAMQRIAVEIRDKHFRIDQHNDIDISDTLVKLVNEVCAVAEGLRGVVVRKKEHLALVIESVTGESLEDCHLIGDLEITMLMLSLNAPAVSDRNEFASAQSY